MNKQQIKGYIIQKAVQERESFHTMERWAKEYSREGKKEQSKEWAQYADVSRARWAVYTEIISLLGAQEDYYKACK